jgi:hypothetical protein
MDNSTIIGLLSVIVVVLIGVVAYQRYYANAQSFIAGAPVRIIGIEYKPHKDIDEIAQMTQRAMDIWVTDIGIIFIDIWLSDLISNQYLKQNLAQPEHPITRLVCGDIKIAKEHNPHSKSGERTIFDSLKDQPEVTPEILDVAVKLNTFIRTRFCVNGVVDNVKAIAFLRAIRASIPNVKPFVEPQPWIPNQGGWMQPPTKTSTVQPVATQPVIVQPVAATNVVVSSSTNWAGKTLSTNGRCGPNFNHTACPGKACCSSFGWCGGSTGQNDDWCGVYKGYDGLYNGEKPVQNTQPTDTVFVK